MTPTHEQVVNWFTPERYARVFSQIVSTPSNTCAAAPDCWIWTGRLNYAGNAEISFTVGKQRYTVLLHRLMYIWRFGDILPGATVRHGQCGTGACCNPLHLIAGDQGQNVTDAVRDGTHGQRKSQHKDRRRQDALAWLRDQQSMRTV